MTEPDNLVLQILRDMRAETASMRAVMATKDDVAEVRAEVHALRADVASDLVGLREDLGDQIVGLRRAVVDYHPSVIGHGVIISGPEARVRRIEQRLDLQPDTN